MSQITNFTRQDDSGLPDLDRTPTTKEKPMSIRRPSDKLSLKAAFALIPVAVALVPILLASMAILWKLTGKLSRMQVFTIVMVVLFGGLTVWFNDERFFKMKTTLVYGMFAVILGIGLLQGRSYLAWVMAEFLPMTHEGWMKLTWRLTVFFAALALANEFVWRTMSTDAWVKIETFGFPMLMFLFLWMQILTLQKHLIDEEEGV